MLTLIPPAYLWTHKNMIKRYKENNKINQKKRFIKKPLINHEIK